MSTITEGLKVDMKDLGREVSALELRTNEGQGEMEETFERQQKEVASIMEQQTRHLREGIKVTRRELEAQLAAVDARTRRAGGGGPGANSTTVKPPKFDGGTSWAVFHRQFEASAFQNNWTSNEKAVHLLSVLQGKAADILHTVPAEATYEDIVGALQDCFGDHQLAAAYRSELKARVQVSSETLQEFAAAVEQLPHRTLVGLPVAFIQTEAAHSFIDGVRDRKVKQNLLMGGDQTPNEALIKTLKLEAAKEAAEPPARLREPGRLVGQVSHLIADGKDGPYAGSAGPPVICEETAGGGRVMTRTRETSACRGEEGPTGITTLNSSIYA